MASVDIKEGQNTFGYLDVDEEPVTNLPPIQDYESTPLVSLKSAIILLESIVPNIKHMLQAIERNYGEPEEGLTQDESNSIRLYSLEWQPRKHSLFCILNSALRSEDRQQLQPWFLFLRLMLTALSHLPSTSVTVYRGANMDLTAKYPVDDTITWWGFSSCIKNRNEIERKLLLTETDQRTLFVINCYSGKNIHQHSIYNDQDELLLLPARRFTVMSSVSKGNGLHIIELNEIQPACHFWSALPLSSNILLTSSKSSTSFLPISTSALCKKPFPAALFNRQLETRIAHMQHRSKVFLKSMNLTDPDMRLVCSEVITKRQCSELNLSMNKFTCNGISILARTLGGNITLTSLILRYNQIGEKGIQCLSEPLQRNTVLTRLNLNGNNIGDQGVQYLSEALRTNTGLTTLILWDNEIGEKGAQYLSDALRTNMTLTVLDLWNNRIGDKGAQYFSEALPKNTKLTIVNFSDNQIEDAGAQCLAEALQQNTTLTILNLFNNSIEIKVGFTLHQKDPRIHCF